MVFKRHNPGCPCSCGAVPPESCLDSCLYKCDGVSPCPTLCGIKITMPEPDTVPQATGPACGDPGEGCPEEYTCDLCYYLFDGLILFNLQSATQGIRRLVPCPPRYLFWYLADNDPENTCDNTTIRVELKPSEDAAPGVSTYNCWDATSASCPECSENILQCASLYGIRDLSIELNITYEGGCSTTTARISYVVFQNCDEEFDIDTMQIINPETRYTHVFERTNQCECNQIFGPMTFVETIIEDTNEGITLPDVCNVDGATVELQGLEECGTCYCFDCDEEGTVVIDLNGPGFDGTVALARGFGDIGFNSCSYGGKFNPTNCSGPFGELDISLEVDCYACGVKQILITIQNETEVSVYSAEITDCNDLPVAFTLESYTPGIGTDCELDAYTISLL
jgi:hypothetical protein